MMRSFTIGVASFAAGLLFVSAALAQPKTAQKPAGQPTQMEQKGMDKQVGQRIEGTVKSIDAKGIVTLEDGTKLMIPKSVSVDRKSTRLNSSHRL